MHEQPRPPRAAAVGDGSRCPPPSRSEASTASDAFLASPPAQLRGVVQQAFQDRFTEMLKPWSMHIERDRTNGAKSDVDWFG